MSETHFETFLRAIANCGDRQRVLGDEGLVFPADGRYRYGATPRNAVTFATMGVDGVHYVILELDGRITDDSPVIQVAPMDFEEPYSLLADSFLEYVAVGCGVTSSEMDQVFDKEREGESILADYLKEHFDQSRLWAADRDRSIDRFRSTIELDPGWRQ